MPYVAGALLQMPELSGVELGAIQPVTASVTCDNLIDSESVRRWIYENIGPHFQVRVIPSER